MKDLTYVRNTYLNQFLVHVQGSLMGKQVSPAGTPVVQNPHAQAPGSLVDGLYLRENDLARLNEELAAAARFDTLIGDGGTPFLVDDMVLVFVSRQSPPPVTVLTDVERKEYKAELVKLIKLA